MQPNMQRDKYGQWMDLSHGEGPRKTIHFECSRAPRTSLGKAVFGAMFEANPMRSLARVATAAPPSSPGRTITMHALVAEGRSVAYEQRAAEQVCRIYGGATRLLPSISGGDLAQ